MKEPIINRNISNFQEKISSLSHSIVFLYFFLLITQEGFIISPCDPLDCCIQIDIAFLSPLPLASLLFTAICKASSDNHFYFFFTFLFLWDGFDHHLLYNVMNLHPQFFRHSIRSNSSNLSLPLYNHKGFDLGHI